jgi:hypothetical protein
VRDLAARIIAFGIWPEHVKCQEASERIGRTQVARKESVE